MPRLKQREPTARVIVRIIEAARMLDVGVTTIRRWLANGTLREVKIPGAQRKVDVASIEKLLKSAPKR
jgi:excisionase family DNA binding protein